MESKIAELLAITYLGLATAADAVVTKNVIDGIIFGRNLRTIFPLVVIRHGKAMGILHCRPSGALNLYLYRGKLSSC